MIKSGLSNKGLGAKIFYTERVEKQEVNNDDVIQERFSARVQT